MLGNRADLVHNGRRGRFERRAVPRAATSGQKVLGAFDGTELCLEVRAEVRQRQ